MRSTICYTTRKSKVYGKPTPIFDLTHGMRNKSHITMTFPRDDNSVKSLNFTLTDPNGVVNTSGPVISVLESNDTLCWGFPVVNNTIEYTLTVNYEYEKDREGYLEMRFYSELYKIGYWLPFDN
ncbi:hypothetical protein CAEBREN_24581 [Caenorhabditis brenneri]|uniref:DUF7154 domain-containing protein n=1 Tax=Caenorhabditis brenneri TaxID=135651 RepID=G0PB14_CAEBE|nr:hypothetical protein CAEBREN_24581 [Caenorhabditis brenneri]